MSVELLHAGFNSYINMSRVLTIADPDTVPIKRLIQQARDAGQLIDITHGRKTKAMVILDTGHVVIAALEPRTLMRRVRDEQDAKGGLGEGT